MTYVGLNPAQMGHFGQTLKKLRDEKGWAQEELAAAAKVSRSLVQNAERSAAPKMKRKTYLKLAAALQKSEEQFDTAWREDLVELPVPPDLKRRIEASAKKAGLSVPDFFSLLVAMADTPAGRQALDRASRKRGKSRIKPAKAVHTASGELHYQK